MTDHRCWMTDWVVWQIGPSLRIFSSNLSRRVMAHMEALGFWQLFLTMSFWLPDLKKRFEFSLLIILWRSAELWNAHFRDAFLVNFCAYGFPFFHRNQEATIIRISLKLAFVFVHASFFYLYQENFVSLVYVYINVSF